MESQNEVELDIHAFETLEFGLGLDANYIDAHLCYFCT